MVFQVMSSWPERPSGPYLSRPARAAAAGIDLRARLTENDAYSVFAALGDLVVTGPTRTNVNDFRAILVEPTEGQP